MPRRCAMPDRVNTPIGDFSRSAASARPRHWPPGICAQRIVPVRIRGRHGSRAPRARTASPPTPRASPANSSPRRCRHIAGLPRRGQLQQQFFTLLLSGGGEQRPGGGGEHVEHAPGVPPARVAACAARRRRPSVGRLPAVVFAGRPALDSPRGDVARARSAVLSFNAASVAAISAWMSGPP